jgi:hypothetical protein
VERVVLGVGPWQRRCSTGVDGTQHVVVGEEVIEAQILDREPNPSDSDWIASQLGLGIDDADLHVVTLPHDDDRPSRGRRPELPVRMGT